MPTQDGPRHCMTMETHGQRIEDLDRAFHTRPFLFESGGHRCPVSPLEAQLLLSELKHLPRSRYPAAAAAAHGVNAGHSRGGVMSVDADEARCLLRAIEGVHARRGHKPGLTALQALLLRRSSAPVV